jgi:hypothetical protein
LIVALASRRVKQITFFTACFKTAYRTTKNAEILINAIKYRSSLRANMRKARKITRRQQAHHIIPIEAVKQCPIVQKAILDGFQINGTINGAALSIKKHRERHAEFDHYNNFALGQLLELQSRYPNIDRAGAREKVEEFAEFMRKYFD